MLSKRKVIFMSVVVLIAITGISMQTFSHCQIPCGIYDDPARFTTLREHISTIEKSMKQIEALSQDAASNTNQIVRWVDNKEHHADELTEIVTYYFLAQRVKPASASDATAFKKYTEQLTLLHKMIVHSMKAKQTTDTVHVETLRNLVTEFEKVYNS